MSEKVKRYNISYNSRECIEYPIENGEYVKYEDYARLEKQLEEMRAEGLRLMAYVRKLEAGVSDD